jgi:RNA-binding protein YlmH
LTKNILGDKVTTELKTQLMIANKALGKITETLETLDEDNTEFDAILEKIVGAEFDVEAALLKTLVKSLRVASV